MMADYDETIAKLKNGEKLNESELITLCFDGCFEDEIDGDSGRWTQGVSTIIDVDGQLYRIDWARGLTEYQDNEFESQPYKVEKVEKVVTKTTVEYVKI